MIMMAMASDSKNWLTTLEFHKDDILSGDNEEERLENTSRSAREVKTEMQNQSCQENFPRIIIIDNNNNRPLSMRSLTT